MTPDRARDIAATAHAGQVDKSGAPYLSHPVRVAGRLEDPDAKVVALLHDVLEDTDISAADLRREGISDRQLTAVEALTHADDVDDLTYWRSVRSVRLARLVKIADIADNTDPARFALLEASTADRLRDKYQRALQVLLWDDGDTGPVRPDDFVEYERILGASLDTVGHDVLDPASA